MNRYDPYTDKLIRDTIDRQAAIDALTKEYYYHDADYMTAVSVINALPSAQPKR